MENNSAYERYHRQIILKDFGKSGQDKLFRAKVLVIGAGGLGCPALLYLVAAGVGQIGVVDDGSVELSNLHRQVLYSTKDIGKLKAACAKKTLEKMNPGITVSAYPCRLHTLNAYDLVGTYDIVIDGTDNFQTRYMVNDLCALLNKPLIYGAVSRYEGQVAVFKDKLNYRDIFPYPPAEEIMNCSQAGILGVLPGIIGNFQANECIKLLTGIGEPLTGELLTYNALNNTLYTIGVTSTALGSQLIPESREAFEATDYHSLCNHAGTTVNEIEPEQFLSLLEKEDIDIVDVRELAEKPELSGFDHLRIPLSRFEDQAWLIKKDTVVFACQSGKRSLLAAHKFEELNRQYKKIYSLKGGVLALSGTAAR